ncbi:hypothetical protein WJX73_008664 [Symbiochloris irregularis]|uniref:prolycopene isomerase n=1 Tax=Symbiochloris irregularis TaxID=706552 RepID=A0AAW1NQL8_9CHLO
MTLLSDIAEKLQHCQCQHRFPSSRRACGLVQRPKPPAFHRSAKRGRKAHDLSTNAAATTTAAPRKRASKQGKGDKASVDVVYDAVVIGGGMGGLTAATQLAAKGAHVAVLEKYLIPGGSAGHFHRKGYTFDVGSSMMFGLGHEGTTNLITRALAAVGKSIDTSPDPSQIHYHLPKSQAHPQGFEVKVWRAYEEFLADLTRSFPHEREGIRKFYDECWRVFNSLNSLDLKSLEEPRYLLGEFAKHPLACLTLASFLTTNSGDVARRHIKDPELLKFIDIECYCWSTVDADMTPMINAGMVFCDRHYGGINYPVGGVGRLGELLVEGLQERGSCMEYKANVTSITFEGEGPSKRATGVRLADGRHIRARSVISNATHWDTFDRLLPPQSQLQPPLPSQHVIEEYIAQDGDAQGNEHAPSTSHRELPESEERFRGRYKKSPAFLTIHAGVRADVLPPGTQCHHIVVEDWQKMEDPHGTLFVSIPSLLDPSLCPEGTHIFHAFTPDWMDEWQGLPPGEYRAKKEAAADAVMQRLEAFFPGLREATVFREVGTPRTHRRFLNRQDGSYGPIPSRRPAGMLGMPMNRTSLQGLYCVGDSTFPGQGVNAVVFSGFGCAHRVLCDLGMVPSIPIVDGAFNTAFQAIRNRC